LTAVIPRRFSTGSPIDSAAPPENPRRREASLTRRRLRLGRRAPVITRRLEASIGEARLATTRKEPTMSTLDLSGAQGRSRSQSTGEYISSVIDSVIAKNPAEPEFHQAVREVIGSLAPVIDKNPAYRSSRLLERVVEPERVLMFRVPWQDDRGEFQVNRGFRIEMNSAIGPYKADCASTRR
jgi:hypothetical protein